MRVLHVICDLSGGGAERLVLELCKRGVPGQRVATVQGGGALSADFAAAGVPVWLGRRRRRSAGLSTVAGLLQQMRGVDLVHTHLFAGDTFGRIAASIAGLPVVTTEHNVNRDEGRWHRAVKRLLAPRTTALVFVSEAARRYAEEVERICHPRASVIPNGVDLARFRPAAPGPGFRILAVGRDVPQKGFDVLVRALPAGARVRVAGASSRRGVVAYGDASVEWLGARADVPELLAESHLLVMPSRWEGFGLAAVEAMAAGVPVIASDVDGLREVVGDAGVLVAAGDPDALRASITALMHDAPRRAQLAARGLARARGFSIQSCVERYTALYQSSLSVH